ncbi:hypothetical protein KKB99_08200, partial [bacterium]|nr:hypothetical protein [bacterium]MBU1025972.1 hypothetical protein [bacterium]
VGVIMGLCHELDIPYLSGRGYLSASEMWQASRRIGDWINQGYKFKLIHLGDHDPSGLNMSVDTKDRIREFLKINNIAEDNFEFERAALNYDQVQKYKLFPNYAKKTDTRAKEYLSKFGSKCWELDALHTEVINGIIQESVLRIRDNDKWNEAKNLENEYRDELRKIAEELELE